MFNPFVRNGTAGCLAPFVLGFAVSQESLSPCVIIIFDKSRPFLREVNFALEVLVLTCSPKDKVACRDRHLHGPMWGKLRLVMQDLAFLLQDLQVNREPTSPPSTMKRQSFLPEVTTGAESIP